MKKRTAALLLAAILLAGGCAQMKQETFFKNEYELPASVAPYTRLDKTPKTDWTARYIWDASDGAEENVWMCLRKTVDLTETAPDLTAYISADSKYWLWINGEPVVFEGGVKRGPTPDGGYYDAVPVGEYLKKGRNVIAALVWYWGKDTSYSSADSGRAGFLFEAGEIVSDAGWRVRRNAAYGSDRKTPNYRLPEFNIYYDARQDLGDWTAPDFDDSAWERAHVFGTGGCAPWGTLYPRGIPMLRDRGLRSFEDADAYLNRRFSVKKKITLRLPYNAQCTPYLKVDAPPGKRIRIRTENARLGAVRDTYITRDGVQEFEAPGWFNGERVTYEIPAGVTVLDLRYRETGYDTAFSGFFACEDERLNTLWQKSLRTLYVTMRDNFMDCPDRERAQWWGDVTSEMFMSMYALDPDAYLLYQKGVACMLGHVDPETRVLQTVVPIGGDYFELPVQQLAGIRGFWEYYLYTGDREFLASVYDASADYLDLWTIGENGLVVHRAGSWDWMDWGRHADDTAIENAWYFCALSSLREMATVLGKDTAGIEKKLDLLRAGYAALWTSRGYKSGDVMNPDDRANALAVLAGLAAPERYGVIAEVLTKTKHSSPYMEYYVLEALCRIGRYDLARTRMLERYDAMIYADCSTLWEFWVRLFGTSNHAWSGGPLVIMSKYFAGLRPTEAGWTSFEAEPRTDVCASIDCAVPTVRGYIRLRAFGENGGQIISLTAPPDTAAVVRLPVRPGQTVACGGALIWRDGSFTDADGLSLAEKGDGFIKVSVSPDAPRELRFAITD